MKSAARATAAVVLLLALAACVAGSSDSAHAADSGFLAQFFLGFWHGLIGPVTMVVEIVGRFFPHLLPWKAHLYETKAAGVAYDFGFYIGLVGSPVIIWSRRR
ncbi:hypothetical protein [Phenylobacterium montanum]|uniref:Uncharacterized protein n=1 Tax=Phenylobacterium montanum TaxID=2823693 RepID=A0A975IXX8_9CAUL|nr:hypothetical protein [Caulobacter sp. S6]QUD89881.1 hypothetical protein KCG34_08465 [Caulobacter sp. S6]